MISHIFVLCKSDEYYVAERSDVSSKKSYEYMQQFSHASFFIATVTTDKQKKE